MANEPIKQHWWQTLTGILTAVAALITAVSGFIIAMDQFGKNRENKPTNPVTTALRENAQTGNTTIQQPAKGKVSAPELAATTTSESAIENKAATYPDRINLFAPENGAELLVSSHDGWQAAIDGKEEWTQIDYGVGQEAVYGFRENKEANFDTFTMLLTGTEGYNIDEFEILAGNESPTGLFQTLGKFKTINAKLVKNPYQEFTLPATRARYVKIKIISLHDKIWEHPAIYEFQLFGRFI